MTDKILTPVTDKNGQQTRRWKNPETAVSGRVSSAGVTISSTAPEAVSPIDSIVNALNNEPQYYTLHYVSQGEGLHKEQITMFLSGDEDFEGTMHEIFEEQRTDYADEEAKKAVEEAEMDWDDLDEDEQEQVLEAVYNNDSGDLIKDLLRETHSQLLRAPLADNIMVAGSSYEATLDPARFEQRSFEDFLYDAMSTEGRELRIGTVSKLLDDAGFDVVAGKAAIEELVDNGPYQWHEAVDIDLIWYGDIKDANVGEWIDGERREKRDLKFEGEAGVLLLDHWNGSGHQVDIPLKSTGMTLEVSTEKPAKLDDSPDGGYGWDAVAGVVKSAYGRYAPKSSEWK